MWSTRWQNGWRRPRRAPIPVDFSQGDPDGRIFEIRQKHHRIQQRRRPGEEKLRGVDWCYRCSWLPSQGRKNPSGENPTQALENALRVVNPTGSVGVIGVYICPDSGAKDEQRKQGIFSFPLANFFEKGLTIGTGQDPVKKYNEYLRDLIVSGRAKPGRIVSHHISIDQAPEAYYVEGYTKVLIRFGEKMAA